MIIGGSVGMALNTIAMESRWEKTFTLNLASLDTLYAISSSLVLVKISRWRSFMTDRATLRISSGVQPLFASHGSENSVHARLRAARAP